MGLKMKAHRHAGTISRRQRWILMIIIAFVLYLMLMIQMWIWSSANHADLRANIINAEDIPKPVSRSTIKQNDEPQEMRVDSSQAEEMNHKQPNLRIVDPSQAIPDTMELLTHESEAPRATNVPEASPPSKVMIKSPSSFAARHDIIFGYTAAMKYLANYTISEDSNERLFLFFVCGDEKGEQMKWRKVCVDASALVYDVFAKSSSHNRLVTIYAGSKTDWSKTNNFYNDVDLKVKMIPALMEWHGGRPGAKRVTTGMIIEDSLLYEPLLRYLFKNEDSLDPLLAPEKIASKEIVLLKGHQKYRQYIETIAKGENPLLTVPNGPMFFYFIAGRLERNERPWCPYCRYSEISVEYAFYAFAPPGSRLVKVETVNSYATWKKPVNEWKSETSVIIRGVPWMFRAELDAHTHTFTFDRVYGRFDHPDTLQELFQT
ncbi:Thioredoxin-like fold [Plasmopara halstedii]|uniref:Thioredoxin-like fold n=1 Tax=Plasmopara halstedii TaxID=4781 RepID=A0A0P1AP46_PLAHL|nr:Thioredoxin-like fold [Plasmopara halstedii]CEG42942.1 Thioredoxin-like fold [Plasmopara halstedii]|eukprot:XP_024579311.1 Thioredoxin-like fold [Plasmopara halstedii]